MKVIFTCGGTGGHINPAIAVAKMMQQRCPGCEILFVGAEGGMEEKLVPREGFRLELLKISNFQRKLTPAGIGHNLATAWNIAGSLRKAGKIIDVFAPDVIVGTGGYASFPTLRQGIRKKIPTAVHESNAIPGLATKMVADRVDCIMVGFAESKDQYKNQDRVRAVGMPVREEFIYTNKKDARKALQLDDRPLIVSCWGSLGAREMNKKIAAFLKLECQNDAWNHIHATGSYGWRWMPDYVKELGVDLTQHPNLELREYIYDMPLLMAAADLVICRAGASTLNEVAASGTPCIIVPSPNAAGNHQEKNAQVFEQRGAALVVRESDCTPERLYEAAKQLLTDQEAAAAMRKAQLDSAVFNSAERILETIQTLAKSR